MAEQPLDADEAGADLPEGLIPPDAMEEAGDLDTPDAPPVGLPPSAASSPPVMGQGPVLLRDRYLIDSGKPLPDLDCATAKAYAVADRRDLARKLYALICQPGLPTRLDAVRALKDQEIRGVLPIAEWDVITWPPIGQQALIIVYELPLGGRVRDRLARKEVKITEYDMPRRVVEPIIEGLQALIALGGPHRAIRPDNIYFLDEDMTQVVLGPHVVSPPGYDQPLVLETLERAMAMPAGRGMGDSREDIYALGVTMVLLLLGFNPVGEVSDDDLLQNRIEHGSYTAICGTARVPIQMIEPLRGMLNDDPTSRWDFNEITNWLTGQKINSAQKKIINKSKKPLTFRGKKHFSTRSLAWNFARYPTDAIKTINSDDFQDWLRRALGNKEMADTIKGALQAAKFHKDNYQGSDDYVLARISCILDPMAPLRYKGLAFMPDGYGPLLAVEWIRNGNPQSAAEILSHDVPALWFAVQPRMYRELMDLQKDLSSLRGLLGINDPGYGLERALYAANPSVSCQSPYVVRDCVVSVEQLLPALDGAANSVDTSSQPMDRHIAAFIVARFDEDIHPHLKALASNKAETSIIGMLSLLAFLQWKLRTPAVLGLSSWIGGLLGPAINAYHNRHTRQELERDIPRLVRKGSLPELFNLIDDAEKRREDNEGFEASRAEWLAAEEEIRDIEGAGDERLTKAERTGQQAAAMFAIIVALTVVSVLMLVEMS